MEIEILKLSFIFLVIIVCVLLKRSIGEAMGIAIICVIILYRIPIKQTAMLMGRSVYEKETLLLISNFLMVTFIQRIMEKRRLLDRAELALERLSGNRRMVCMITPVIIGFLPAAGAVNICGKIVNDTVKDDLTVEEKTFVASYYRHISESFSPTYSGILLALTITGVSAGAFVAGMIPLVIILMILGNVFYLQKIDKRYGTDRDDYNKAEEWKQLWHCFWPLIISVVIVVMFDLSVVVVLPVVIIAAIILYRLTKEEIIEYAKSSVETRVIINTIMLMIFRNLLMYTGVVERLPLLFEGTGLREFAAYGIIMFLGTMMVGANAMIVLILPLVFSTVTGAGVAMLVFLMTISYVAMQISPAHICLTIATEYFRVSWIDLVKKTLPVIGAFLLVVFGYYLFLVQLGL